MNNTKNLLAELKKVCDEKNLNYGKANFLVSYYRDTFKDWTKVQCIEYVVESIKENGRYVFYC